MYTIYFDMDGTIADLYNVENWLPKLRAENPSPYVEAEAMVDTGELQLYLSILQNRGCKLGVISWLSKGSSKSYDKMVRQAKKNWLRENLPEITFDETHFVKYGTRKDYIAKDKDGILFDDSEEVRNNWRGIAVNPNTEDIIEFLKKVKELTE
jgi:phosphoglycolate phosphatase-like HAD superfamily hydrolase